jgi:hypothetical protein
MINMHLGDRLVEAGSRSEGPGNAGNIGRKYDLPVTMSELYEGIDAPDVLEAT